MPDKIAGKDMVKSITKVVITLIALFIVIEVVTAMVWPIYNVWASEKRGQAELAQATFNRKIAVQEAEAKKESAQLLAEAEVLRAQGVAKANQIIGESLKDNEEYLRYLWITDVAGANIDKTVVYVPTETNLPILEAGRMNTPALPTQGP